jgi:hypothetical protein
MVEEGTVEAEDTVAAAVDIAAGEELEATITATEWTRATRKCAPFCLL